MHFTRWPSVPPGERVSTFGTSPKFGVVPLSDGNIKADVAIDAGRVHETVIVGHCVDLCKARPFGAVDLPRHATPQLRHRSEKKKEGRTNTAKELKGRTDPVAAKS